MTAANQSVLTRFDADTGVLTVAFNRPEARNALNPDMVSALLALFAELRDRPERPAGGAVPTGGAGQVACTGAQLYRPDAAFLIGESAAADQLRLDLADCQARYDSAVRLTN